MSKHGHILKGWTRPSAGFVSAVTLAMVALVYVMLGSHSFHPRYIVNDNIINLNFIIAGYPVDYMGVFLTGLLHRAYVFQPAVPWYPLSLYGMHVISVFMWLTLIWRVFKPWWVALVCSGVLFAYYLLFLVELDYTSTSEMLCISSLAWACLEVLERRQGYLRYLGLGFVFTLGMLTRPQGIIGAFACVLPAALMIAGHCLRERPTKEEMRRLVLVVAVFMAPAVLNWAADSAYRHYTMTPQQAAYEAFNEPRGILHGLSPERQSEINMNRQLMSKAGWTVGNGQSFFQWRYLDERIFTPASLQTLLAGAPYAAHPFKDILDHALLMLGSETGLLLLLLCSLPFFLSAVRQHPWLAGLGLLLPLYCVMLDSFLSVFLTFRDRTEVPFVTSFGLLTLVIAGYLATHPKTERGKSHVAFAVIGVLLALIGVVTSVKPFLQTDARNVRWGNFSKSVLDVVNRDYPGSIVLLQPIFSLQLEDFDPLEPPPVYFHPIDMVWDTFSPYFYDEIKPLGIQHGYELVDALIDNKNAYFLGRDRDGAVFIDQYAHRPKGSVQMVLMRRVRRDIGLFRFVTVKQPQRH